MINNVQKYTPADIFNPDKDIRFIIPKYQREYTWGRDNWDALLDDISENPEGHFIGSIICINRSNDSYDTQSLDLVDGQQRITTLTLLYAAIYKKLSELSNGSEELKFELHNLKNRIVLKNSDNLRVELSVQNNNHKDLLTALNLAGLADYPEKNLNWGNRIIAKAFRHFYEYRLNDYSMDDLLSLLKSVNSALLVKIEVNSTSDAFMLFESLNNRGVPLSPIDLVKNSLLAKLDKKGDDIDEAFKKWNIIIDNLPSESDQERFLRQYYNGFKYDKAISITGKPKATRTNLIKIYEELMNRDVDFLFDDLVAKSIIYNEFVDPLGNDEYTEYDTELFDLVNVKATPSYTFLLYLFSRHKDLEPENYKEVLRYLTKWFVRRNLTDYPSTNQLDGMFMRLIEQIENNEIQIDVNAIHRFLSQADNMSTIEVFRSKLEGDIYEMNTDMTRFVLSKIEESKQGTREHRGLWEREKNKLVWTIEHVFPEGYNIPKSWVKMIADGDTAQARILQQEYVHTLGNLTLTGYNSTLSNMSFEKKRDRKKDNKYVGYKNGLYLNEELKDKEVWTIDDIRQRTGKLVGEAVEIFKFEDE